MLVLPCGSSSREEHVLGALAAAFALLDDDGEGLRFVELCTEAQAQGAVRFDAGKVLAHVAAALLGRSHRRFQSLLLLLAQGAQMGAAGRHAQGIERILVVPAGAAAAGCRGDADAVAVAHEAHARLVVQDGGQQDAVAVVDLRARFVDDHLLDDAVGAAQFDLLHFLLSGQRVLVVLLADIGVGRDIEGNEGQSHRAQQSFLHSSLRVTRCRCRECDRSLGSVPNLSNTILHKEHLSITSKKAAPSAPPFFFFLKTNSYFFAL